MDKISRGAGFRGALNYVFDRDKKDRAAGKEPGVLIGGNMVGHDPRTLAAEFGIARRLRSDIKKPVWHSSLRLPAGESLSLERWTTICDEYMQRMGFSPENQRCYVLHDDEDGQHCHIVASRIGLDSKIFYGRQENLISTRVIHQLEKDHGLRITKGPGLDEPTQKRNPTKNEAEKALRTGQRPPKLIIQDTVDQILAAGPASAPDFVELLKSHGITARSNIASTGKFSGFSFGLDGDTNKSGQPIFYKGSSLGKAYTAAGLLDRGLQYDAHRDMPLLTGKHPEPAPDYSGDPAIRRKNGGRALSLIIFMRFEPLVTGGQLYRWQSGAPAFVDRGAEIICAGRATDAKVRGMLDLAAQKGWTRIELSGPRDFQIATALEAARRGISVSGANREIQELWRQEYDRTAEARDRKSQSRRDQLHTSGPPAQAGRGLRGLPELDLVSIGAGPELLLQDDARRNLGFDVEVPRDLGLRREGLDGVETRVGPATPPAPIGTAPLTSPAGGETAPAGHRGTASSIATGAGGQGDGHRAEVSVGESRKPGQALGRSQDIGDPRDTAWRAGHHQEDSAGRAATGPPEDRPRRAGSGLEALKSAPRRPASEDRRGLATTEERPARVAPEEAPPPPRPKYPTPGM